MKALVHVLGSSLLVACLAVACGDEPAAADATDTSDASAEADRVADGVEDARADDVESAADLCARMWDRLVACGHFYTFPTFEDVCAAFTPSEVEVLRGCSVKPCAGLYACVRDDLHVPVGDAD